MPDKDRRSITSRQNIADYVPDPLSATGSATIATRVPRDLIPALDKARGDLTRSQYLRNLLEEHLDYSRST